MQVINIIGNIFVILFLGAILIEELIRINKMGINTVKWWNRIYTPKNNLYSIAFILFNLLVILLTSIVIMNSFVGLSSLFYNQ
jgi:hypothetical protein